MHATCIRNLRPCYMDKNRPLISALTVWHPRSHAFGRYLARSYLSIHYICGSIRIFQIKPFMHADVRKDKVGMPNASTQMLITISLTTAHHLPCWVDSLEFIYSAHAMPRSEIAIYIPCVHVYRIYASLFINVSLCHLSCITHIAIAGQLAQLRN